MSENWVEITFRRLRDKSLRVRSANMRRKLYTNRITFKGGMMLEEVLRPSLGAEIMRMADQATQRSSVQEFPDFHLDDKGIRLHGCSLLASHEGDGYQQFMVRLNKVDGHMYSIFADGLIEEDTGAIGSPESIVELVRQKVVEPVNKLSTVFEGYDKDTTFAIIPAYFNVLRRLMNTRLEKLEAALRGPQTLRLEHKSDDIGELDAPLAEPQKKVGNGP